MPTATMGGRSPLGPSIGFIGFCGVDYSLLIRTTTLPGLVCCFT